MNRSEGAINACGSCVATRPCSGMALGRSSAISACGSLVTTSTGIALRGEAISACGSLVATSTSSGIARGDAISACGSLAMGSRPSGRTSYGMALRGIAETTPKERCQCARNGMTSSCSMACLDSNQCREDGLALRRRRIMEKNYTQEIQEIDMGSRPMRKDKPNENDDAMDMGSSPSGKWIARGFGTMDVMVERIFLIVEDLVVYVAAKEIVYDLGKFMRQMMELMTVERMWMSWLAAMGILLTVSHLGQWKAVEPTRWTRATASCRSTRMARMRMREKKVQFKIQLKALLFASWIQCCSGMESPSGAGQGENAFTADDSAGNSSNECSFSSRESYKCYEPKSYK